MYILKSMLIDLFFKLKFDEKKIINNNYGFKFRTLPYGITTTIRWHVL